MDLFLRVDLSQGSLNPTMLVNKVIDEISCVFVLQSFLINPSLVKKLFQVGVNIFQIKSMIGIPSDVADMLEVGG